MNTMVWQEIAVRLLFTFILGSATAISKKWYQTKLYIQPNTLMALGAAMFSILASSTSETKFSPSLIIGISIICAGIGFQQADTQASVDRIMRLWCAGAVGSMVGFGLLVPSYIAILVVILTNLLFSVPEKDFTPYIEKDLNNNSQSKIELSATKSTISQEICYRCQVNCFPVDEAEVLALLVQLGKEQNLTPIGVRSINLVDDNSSSEIEIQLDFVSDSDRNLLQLQEVLMSLKSQLKVNSVSWLDLSSELSSKNKEVLPENDRLI